MILSLLLHTGIYSIAFLIVHYFKRGYLIPTESDALILLLILSVTIPVSLITGSYKKELTRSSYSRIKKYFICTIISLGIITTIVYFIPSLDSSRILLLGTVSLAFLGQIVIALPTRISHEKIESNFFTNFSGKTFLIDSFLLIWIFAFVLTIYEKQHLLSDFYLLLAILAILWFLSGIFSHRFPVISKSSPGWTLLWKFNMGGAFLFLLTSIFIFMLAADKYTGNRLIFGAALYWLWSVLITGLRILINVKPKTDEVGVSFFSATELVDREVEEEGGLEALKEKYNFHEPLSENGFLSGQLERIYLRGNSKEYDFINDTLELGSFKPERCIMIRSADIYNVEVLPANYMEFYMNLHEMNDMRRVNYYFTLVNKCLKEGGIFFSRFEPTRLRQQRYLTKYPFYLANIFYFFDFVWRRVIPKLPFLQKVYFALTKGKYRALSMAEGLGRLYFCGFEIISLKEINNHLYFIAKKVKEPLLDKSPSYGPFFKMKRTGKDGKDIYVYKFRTMHPYSEYLQQFIYDNFRLKDGGKFDQDFRITSWGKVMRKLWLDEWPMFINVFKGQLKIVGIRPLSKHYAGLYDPAFLEERNKFKPGLVPPYYVDMPGTIEEVQESELKYLEKYKKHPLLTDVQYFSKAWYNIVVKRARSG